MLKASIFTLTEFKNLQLYLNARIYALETIYKKFAFRPEDMLLKLLKNIENSSIDRFFIEAEIYGETRGMEREIWKHTKQCTSLRKNYILKPISR